jgi:hypothetical protein
MLLDDHVTIVLSQANIAGHRRPPVSFRRQPTSLRDGLFFQFRMLGCRESGKILRHNRRLRVAHFRSNADHCRQDPPIMLFVSGRLASIEATHPFPESSRRGRPPGSRQASTPKEKVTVWIKSSLIGSYRDWTWQERCQLSHLVERALAEDAVGCRFLASLDVVQVLIGQLGKGGIPPVAIADDTLLGLNAKSFELTAGSDKILVELLSLAAGGRHHQPDAPWSQGFSEIRIFGSRAILGLP